MARIDGPIWILIIAALVACGGTRVPPVVELRDPALHEIYLLAFAQEGPAYVVLERISGEALRIVNFDPAARRRTPIPAPGDELDEALRPWPDRTELVARVRATDLGRTIEAQGFTWAESVDRPGVLGATVEIDAEGVRLRDGDDTAELMHLPDAPQDQSGKPEWSRSADGRRLGLELRYPGEPAVRILHVLEVAEALADLWFGRGYEAHLAGEWAEASRLWAQVETASPSRPEVAYNLACATARRGDPDAAMVHLERAVGLDRPRMRALARGDPDLASLRERQDFLRLVWTPDPDDAD